MAQVGPDVDDSPAGVGVAPSRAAGPDKEPYRGGIPGVVRGRPYDLADVLVV